MKLFKRTSIFLFIFILIIWVANFIWIYYPLNTVKATKNEIKQTEILLKGNNITITENILDKKVKSVESPEIEFIAHNTDLFEEYVTKGKLSKVADNLYMYGDNSITIDGNALIFEGYSDLIEKNTPDTARVKARKLISYLNLSSEDMLVNMQERQDGILVTFVPEYKDKPVYDCIISVMMYGAKKYKVTATPYVVKTAHSKVLPITVCTAVAEFALSENAKDSHITEATLGYVHKNGRLVPMWGIHTKENNTFYIG